MDSPIGKGKMGTLELQKVQSIKSTNALNVAAAVGHCVPYICSDVWEWANCTFVTCGDLCSGGSSHVCLGMITA